MSIQQLTEVQKKMLNNMCISAQEVNMGTLLSNLITSVNEGGTGFVPIATIEVAGKVKASSEIAVDEEGVMSIVQVAQVKVKGLVETLASINRDIEQIEEDVNEVEEKISVLEESQQWGTFPC